MRARGGPVYAMFTGLMIFGLLSIPTLLAGRQALAGPDDDLTELKEGGVHSGVEELEVALGVEEQNGITQCEILEPRALRPLTALYCGIRLLPATRGSTGAATINRTSLAFSALPAGQHAMRVRSGRAARAGA